MISVSPQFLCLANSRWTVVDVILHHTGHNEIVVAVGIAVIKWNNLHIADVCPFDLRAVLQYFLFCHCRGQVVKCLFQKFPIVDFNQRLITNSVCRPKCYTIDTPYIVDCQISVYDNNIACVFLRWITYIYTQ